VPGDHQLLVGRDRIDRHPAASGRDAGAARAIGRMVELDAEPGGLPDFEKPLKFDEASCRWRLLDMSAAEARATSDQAAIIQLMRTMGDAGLMRSQIAAALDRSKTAVSHMLARMEAAGIVERVDSDLWKLTV
jgi:MarR family